MFERVAEHGASAPCPVGASAVSPIRARRLLASVRMTTQILETTTARTCSVRVGWRSLAVGGTIKSKYDARPLRIRSSHMPTSQRRRTKPRWYVPGRLHAESSARSRAWRGPPLFHAALRICSFLAITLRDLPNSMATEFADRRDQNSMPWPTLCYCKG